MTMENLTTSDVSALSTEQVQSLTTTDAAALTTSDVSALVAGDVAPVNPTKKAKATVRTQVKKPVVNVVTAETTTKTDVEDTEVDELPAKITLAAPYAFYDDDGKLHSWLEGSVVEDSDTIALLIGRGVILKAE
jgi:ALTTAQ repeat